MNYMKTMLNLQDEFNETTCTDWKSKKLDWQNYIMIEAAEQNASLNFKHWKNGKDDIQNFKVEVIDNWHFLMSLGLERYSVDYLANTMNELWEESSEDFDEVDLTNATQYFCYNVLCTKFENDFEDNFYRAVFVLFEIMQQLELSLKDVYENYLVKNALNIIRQKNGYKDGTYKKMWNGVDGKVYEDNVIAVEMIHESTTLNELLQDLQNYYNVNVRDK